MRTMCKSSGGLQKHFQTLDISVNKPSMESSKSTMLGYVGDSVLYLVKNKRPTNRFSCARKCLRGICFKNTIRKKYSTIRNTIRMFKNMFQIQ